VAKTIASLNSREGAAPADRCRPNPMRLLTCATAAYTPLFRALGDETRLEIVGLLAACGQELCACEIESRFDLSQPTVSHHLRILREAGIVTAERRGTWVYYALAAGARARLRSFDALLGP